MSLMRQTSKYMEWELQIKDLIITLKEKQFILHIYQNGKICILTELKECMREIKITLP